MVILLLHRLLLLLLVLAGIRVKLDLLWLTYSLLGCYGLEIWTWLGRGSLIQLLVMWINLWYLCFESLIISCLIVCMVPSYGVLGRNFGMIL